MRKLSKRQKEYLDKLMKERSLRDVDDMTREEFKELETMNDYETLHQDANRHITDAFLRKVYGLDE
jgi:hypothetical protein